MVDRDEYKQQSLDSWDAMAPGWKRRRDWLKENTGRVNDWIVARADPQPGQTWLDVAGGPGDLSFALAERVGDDGHVIYTDFSPEMVEVARGAGETRGAGSVEFRVLDAERMDLDDDSVDGVGCRYGYMLMADPAAALRETRRVLRDGGPLSFAVWSTPDRNPWAAIPAMTLVQRGHVPPPEPGAPGIFALGMPERIRELVTGAGCAEPEIEEIAFEFQYPDDDDFWDALVRLAGPLARVINALPDEEQQATRAAITENVETYRNDDGSYTVPAASWGVLTR
jgi:ubiquinone/menaquinone biosynthesis C-methylase UbiE